jgi:hypothetical protein
MNSLNGVSISLNSCGISRIFIFLPPYEGFWNIIILQ